MGDADDDAEAERSYIRRHGVHIALEQLVGDALRLRPAEPLPYIAVRLLAMRGLSQPMEDLLKAYMEVKPQDADFNKFVGDQLGLRLAPDGGGADATPTTAAAAAAAAGVSGTPGSVPAASPGAAPGADGGAGKGSLRSTAGIGSKSGSQQLGASIAERKQQKISARACSVCGRDDRPGEQRAKGFKCYQCVGIPSNPYFVKQIEEAASLLKGRDEDGGFVMNEYTIMAALGQGAYGKVRLCVHNVNNQTYAVKCLSKANIIKGFLSGNPTAKKDDALKQIRDEIKIMKRLEHPNIIRIYGTMESDSEIMIVMEYLEGGQVYTSDFPAEPMVLRRLKPVIVGIAKGLDFLHNNGIIHRDIKPDNILKDKRGNVKLADFGVSSETDGNTGEVRGFAGSPMFMSPELFDDGNEAHEGEPTDVWSFGVTAYCMAFGRLPPNFASDKGVQELGQSIRETEIPFQHQSEPLNEVLSKMLDKNPKTRIKLPAVCDSDFLRDIRIVKGHPVATIEVSLKYNQEKALTLGPDKAGDEDGKNVLESFLEKSGEFFQIISVNAYEVSLYDIARDPRRQIREKAPIKKAPVDRPEIEEEDWDDDDLEDEGM